MDPENWSDLHTKVINSTVDITKRKGCCNWGVGICASEIVDAIVRNTCVCITVSTFLQVGKKNTFLHEKNDLLELVVAVSDNWNFWGTFWCRVVVTDSKKMFLCHCRVSSVETECNRTSVIFTRKRSRSLSWNRVKIFTRPNNRSSSNWNDPIENRSTETQKKQTQTLFWRFISKWRFRICCSCTWIIKIKCDKDAKVSYRNYFVLRAHLGRYVYNCVLPRKYKARFVLGGYNDE